VVKKALFDDGEELVAFVLRGCDTLQEVKACNSVGANELVDASAKELEAAGIVVGYVGPIDLKIRTVVDLSLKDEECCIVGANEEGYHFVGASFEQFRCDLLKDIVQVNGGDSCIKCGGKLEYKKGIEVGHIFQLEDRYSKPLDATFLDENGKTQNFVMGTYGIGVSRLIAAVIEQHHDEKGCKWTKQTAPYLVSVVVANAKDEQQLTIGTQIYDTLRENGVSVILDDRKDRFGAKMKDFELIGFPYAVIVGKNAIDGKVEVVNRDNLDKIEIGIGEILNHLGV